MTFRGKSHKAAQRRILVLDGDMAATLAVVRSLGTAGYQVHLSSAAERPIAGFSNRVAAKARYPDPLNCEAEFVSWIVEYCGSASIDLVIPVTERSLVPLARHRDDLRSIRVSMAGPDGLEVALDKSKTFALAENIGVKIPSGYRVTSLGEVEELLPSLSWPTVIKPVRSVSFDGLSYRKHSVSYASGPEDLRRQLNAILSRTPVMLQEHFAGLGVGIELIAKEGEILYAFQHQRLHEVPLSGGGSSFRKSTEISQPLLDASARLMRGLSWHGVAMVEFKYDPQSQDYRLMEINGRLWGSLPLATSAGADFPVMMAELELEGSVTTLKAYRRDVYCRKLSRDIAWFEQVLRTRPGPTVNVPKPFQVLKDTLRVITPSHYFDVQSFDDPVPGFVDVYRIAKSYLKRLGDLVAEKRFTTVQRLDWRNGSVRESLRQAKKVLVLCYGNINRSALAGVLLQPRLQERGVTLVSAGFHPEDGRQMDPVMADIARSRGVDVEGFRSSTVSRSDIESSDIVFVMEKRHFDEVLKLSPTARERTFLLGSCLADSKGGEAEIPDPYGKPREVYERCFASIENSVARLLSESFGRK